MVVAPLSPVAISSEMWSLVQLLLQVPPAHEHLLQMPVVANNDSPLNTLSLMGSKYDMLILDFWV